MTNAESPASRDVQPLPLGRLAPSPTGAQHVGNARTYLLAWLSIRARHGRLILRIEDIDSPRVKAGAADQAVEDLRWLGLDWDEGPDVGGPNGPFVQTERMTDYERAFAELCRQEKVYPCTCPRSDVAAAASAPHRGAEGPAYSGRCADRTANDACLLRDRPYCWRFRSHPYDCSLPPSFHDLVAGPVSSRREEHVGDYVVWKASKTPGYQLAVVVDDAAMGITEVFRGDDLIPSTFRQLELYKFFGWRPPAFGHVPLVVGPDGRRLAKRHGDTRLATLRKRGLSAPALVGVLAWSCGLQTDPRPCTPHELLEHFSYKKIPTTPFVWTKDVESLLDRAR